MIPPDYNYYSVTVSVVLAVLVGSACDTVSISTVPALTPVAVPSLVTVATVGSLLVTVYALSVALSGVTATFSLTVPPTLTDNAASAVNPVTGMTGLTGVNNVSELASLSPN